MSARLLLSCGEASGDLYAGALIRELLSLDPSLQISGLSCTSILLTVVAGMLYPGSFSNWGNIDLRNKLLILFIIQLVMFGMGTHMSIKDFNGYRIHGKRRVGGLALSF